MTRSVSRASAIAVSAAVGTVGIVIGLIGLVGGSVLAMETGLGVAAVCLIVVMVTLLIPERDRQP